MLIRALPASGKTVLASVLDDVTDGDELLTTIIGGTSHAHLEVLWAVKRTRDELLRAMRRADEGGVLIVNYDPTGIYREPDFVIGYTPDTYIRHLLLAKRHDLLDHGAGLLKTWAYECVLAKQRIILPCGAFITAGLLSVLRSQLQQRATRQLLTA